MSKNFTFKAYITNLGKYNEGELVGEWVEFPIDEDEFEEVLQRIGISDEPDEDGNYYEEWFVTDYECDLPGFDWQELGEYTSYDKLNEYGEFVEEMNAGDSEMLLNVYEAVGDIEEAKELIEKGNVSFYPGVTSEEDLAYYIIDEYYGGVGDLKSDQLESYFDYEMLGRDLSFDEYETDEKDEDGNTIYQTAGEYWCGDENATDEEIGEAFVDEVGFDGVSDASNYFDYKAFGRDLVMNGDFTFTENGCVEIY